MTKTSRINDLIKSYKENKNTTSSYLVLMIGIDMTVSVTLGMVIGYMVDKYIHTKPTFMILLVLIGFITGFRRILK